MKKGPISLAFLIMLVLSLTANTKLAFSQDLPLVYVDPDTITGLAPSQNFTITVKVANITNLYGFDIRVRWDPAVIDYVSHISKFPADDYPDGILWEPGFQLMDQVNKSTGTYWMSATSLEPAPSFNGTGTFFEMTFHVETVGRSLIEIYFHDLADRSADPIEHNVQHGFFSNYTPTPASIYVNPSKVVDADLTPSNNFTVNVNLDNVVDLENLEFWLGYNTTILDIVDVTANPAFLSPIIDIFEAQGKMQFNASASPPITGNIVLAAVTFHVADIGESVLDLYSITFIDDWGETVPYNEPTDGYFSNVLKAKLFVDPPEIIDPTLTPGSEFSIDIQIDDVFDLYEYSFHMSYDTNVLTALGVIISPPTNDTNFTTEMSIIDENGDVAVNVTYYPPAEPITLLANTTIVTIYFQVQSYGCTVLDLYDTQLVDQFGSPIAHDVGDGFFCTLIADVAINSVEPSPNKVYSGRIVNITIVAANLGDTTETFNVTAYADLNTTVIGDEITIGTQTVSNLPSGLNTTIIITWNTTGLQPCSNFTISAEASPVPYELNLTNNLYVDGFVKIKLLGDVNGDGVIDIFDIVLAANSYGSQEGDPDWNAEADVAPPYGSVDIYDMVTIASKYGESC